MAKPRMDLSAFVGRLLEEQDGDVLRDGIRVLGDVLIRTVGESSFELVDATTREQIAIVPALQVAVQVAGERGGAVWRENVDSRGRPLGHAVLLLPRSTVRDRNGPLVSPD